MVADSEETRTFTIVRRWSILAIGLFGLLAEILTPADARPILLVTDLILVGIVPVEVFLHSRFRERNGG
jgi:hypothetical protein